MSPVEKLEMEEIIKEEKCRRMRETASTGANVGDDNLVDDDEVNDEMRDLKTRVEGRLEQLNTNLDNEKKIFEERLRAEVTDFNRKHETERRRMTDRHARDKSGLAAKHKQAN